MLKVLRRKPFEKFSRKMLIIEKCIYWNAFNFYVVEKCIYWIISMLYDAITLPFFSHFHKIIIESMLVWEGMKCVCVCVDNKWRHQLWEEKNVVIDWG